MQSVTFLEPVVKSPQIVSAERNLGMAVYANAAIDAEFDTGRDAFRRGEIPQKNWSEVKNAGWECAGELAYLNACESEGMHMRDGWISALNAEAAATAWIGDYSDVYPDYQRDDYIGD